MRIRSRERFDELRRLQGLSQRKLADLARVSQAFISLIIGGKRGARPETAWRIANALNVFVDDIFTSEETQVAEIPTPQPAPQCRGRLTEQPPRHFTSPHRRIKPQRQHVPLHPPLHIRHKNAHTRQRIITSTATIPVAA
ncbi:helix-turn-helix transcriptional regulator [Streptomyces yunnanensis]|uniref:helix-turn-helix transcriptional regulator n=1 Tax=Streptomyces yunnanensis TaxID=156453 RepID=UPI0009366B07|nr:helix-turn-helix transcriptional regulator [Streptomyces yunnanensis]